MTPSENTKRFVEAKIDSIDKIPWVSEVPIIIKNKETGFKAIVDEISGDTIVIVPTKYQFIQHRVVAKQALEIEGLEAVDLMLLKGGKQLYIELRSKDKFELLPQDYIERRVRIINAYDKNAYLTVQAYAMRLVCNNGMVAPRLIKEQRIIAFGKNIFKGEMEQAIKEAFDVWLGVKPLIEKAQQTTVSVKDFVAEFGNILPKKYMKLVLDNLDERETVYDIWNQLTYVISHYIEPRVKKSCLVAVQKKVNKVLEMAVAKPTS